MKVLSYPLGLCAASALLAGCAVNTTRLDRGTAMGQAGERATGQTRELVEQVRSESREVLVDLVATDPNCAGSLPSPVIIGRGGGPGLCRVGPALGGDFQIKRWTDLEFAPSLAVIDGLSAYLGAVDAVLTRKPIDIGEELGAAQAKLEAVSGLFSAISGIRGLPRLTSEQDEAIQSTLALISELLTESRQVDDLRRIELKLDPAEFEKTLDRLDRVNRELILSLEAQLLHRQTISARELKRVLPPSALPAPQEPFAVRRAIADQHLTAIERRESLPALGKALGETVTAFRLAHAAYRDLLFNSKAQRTRAEKRKEAAVTERRVLAALSNLTSLVRAF